MVHALTSFSCHLQTVLNTILEMPPRQGNKWKCEQVGDHKDYKRSSNVHNQKISEYHAWYMNEQKKKAVFEPNSTAVGVNNLSQVANQVGFAICANVTEKAEMFVVVCPPPLPVC